MEYKDKESDTIDVVFEVVDSSVFDLDKPVSVVIWTTTPWTLPANEAVALHPELDYVLVDLGEQCFLLAEELFEASLERFNLKAVSKLDKVYKGSDLEGVLLQHPFYNKQVPIILGEHVTTETGFSTPNTLESTTSKATSMVSDSLSLYSTSASANAEEHSVHQ